MPGTTPAVEPQIWNITGDLTMTATGQYDISPLSNGRIVWIVCQAVVVVCTLTVAYLLVCLVLFWRSQNKRNVCRTSIHESSQGATSLRASICFADQNSVVQTPIIKTTGVTTQMLRTGTSTEKKYKRWMLLLAILAATTAVVKFLTDQVKFFYAWELRSDIACEVANDVTEIGLYGSTLVFVYGFLWLRQWMFYHDPAVRQLLYGKTLIRFSRALPITILALSTIIAIVNILPWRYRAHTGADYVGCLSVYSLNNPAEAWPIAAYLAVTSMFQFSLMFLYIYPFVKRKLDLSKQMSTKSNFTSVLSNRKSVVQTYRTGARQGGNSTKNTNKNLRKLALFNNNFGSMDSTVKKRSELKVEIEDFDKQVTRKYSSHTTQQCLKQKKNRKEKLCFHNKTETQLYSLEKKKTTGPKVFNSVRRVVLWYGLCVLNNVATVSGSLSLSPGMPLVITTALNNVNTLVNIICLVATYSCWRDILMPWLAATITRHKRVRDNFGSHVSDSGCDPLNLSRHTVEPMVNVNIPDLHHNDAGRRFKSHSTPQTQYSLIVKTLMVQTAQSNIALNFTNLSTSLPATPSKFKVSMLKKQRKLSL